MVNIVHYRKPGLLKQFVADLHSGKLHREFHHGPDPEQPQQIAQDAAVSTCMRALPNFDT
jgi:hypothetical protein